MNLLSIWQLMLVLNTKFSMLCAFKNDPIYSYHQNRSAEFYSCTIPYEMIQSYKDYLGPDYCKKISQKHGVCARNISALFTYSPPLIYVNDEGYLSGALKDHVEDVFVNRCCLGCNAIVFDEFIESNYSYQKFVYNANQSTEKVFDILMPVDYRAPSATGNTRYLGHDVTRVFDLDKIYIIGKKEHVKPTQISSKLLFVVLESWPLFLIAFSMTISAGSIIWITDQWNNKEQFPQSFPRGPFEGFWWAYVSMTTVGYGDRTPSTVLGRLFAVIWILIGITIFNMFTATITTALSTEVKNIPAFTLSDKIVGVIYDKQHTINIIYKKYAHIEYYYDLYNMTVNLTDSLIDAIALDDITYTSFEMQFKNTDFEVKLTIPMKNYFVGIATLNVTSEIRKFQEMFNEYTQDEYSAKHHLQSTMSLVQTSSSSTSSTPIIFSPEYDTYYYVIGATIGVTLLCIILNMIIHSFKRRQVNIRS